MHKLNNIWNTIKPISKKNEDDYGIGRPLGYTRGFYKKYNNHQPLTIQTFLLFTGIVIGFLTATWIRSHLLRCSYLRSSCCSHSHLIDEILHENAMNNKTNNIKIFTDIEPEKSLVFIGVMTAQKYLDTRARAVYETWGKQIPGKISFFSRAGSSSKYDIPLVSLPGVDDKKSFMMLKFIHDNYLDKFEWFMRVDDDVYIKHDKLSKLLRSLNSSVPQFIGQAGLGNKDEFGLLSLDYDENFCMGGPGIVMSRETLRRVVPHISYCLKNLYSTHEDVEMQHIFHHNNGGNDAFTGNLLTPENMRATSLHPIKKPKYLYRLHNFVNQRKIIDLRQQYFNLERQIFRLKNELYTNDQNAVEHNTQFRGFLKECVSKLDQRFLKSSSLNDAKNPIKREDRNDFDFFTRSLFSSTYVSPKRRLEGFWQASIVENLRQIMDTINSDSIDRGRLIDYKDTLYGYMRNHPLVGLDYIIDILLVYKRYEGRKMTVPVRRHAYIRNSFVTMLFREDPLDTSIFIDIPQSLKTQSTSDQRLRAVDSSISLVNYFMNIFGRKNSVKSPASSLRSRALQVGTPEMITNSLIGVKVVNFVVSLSGRWEIFLRFMKNYETVCLKGRERTRLVVVLFENRYSESVEGIRQSEAIKSLFDGLRKEYQLDDENRALNLVVHEGNFSRSIGCELGAATFDLHDLIFFVDVDIAFTKEFLLRARLNTIEYRQVYYPIVFSEYNPDKIENALKIKEDLSEKKANIRDQIVRENHFDFNLDTGYWRNFGFGILATYNSDLKRVGGFDKSIVGWGKEDVDLYEKFINSNLTNFRAVDPGLVHVFHKIECDSGLNDEQMIMCIGSKSTSIASQQMLSDLIYDKFDFLLGLKSRSKN